MDLTLTGKLLKEATDFAKEVSSNGGKVLLVGTKRQAAPVVKEIAEKYGLPFVTERPPTTTPLRLCASLLTPLPRRPPTVQNCTQARKPKTLRRVKNNGHFRRRHQETARPNRRRHDES
jgi:hypothetical protein